MSRFAHRIRTASYAATNPNPPSLPPNAQTLYTNQTPVTVNANDGQAILCATRFSSNVAGDIIGMRFFRATTAPNAAIGLLYSDAGQELARAPFGTLTTGWNTIAFSPAIPITAGVFYRIGYHTNGPYVAATGMYPLSNGQSLTATGSFFRYTATPAFPTNASTAAYFADPIFLPDASITVPQTVEQPTAGAGDESMTINWVQPANGGSAITGYDILNDTTGEVTSAGVGTSTVISNLINGTAYSFRVRAINSVGTGAYSPASTTQRPSPLPAGFPGPTTTGYAPGSVLTLAPVQNTTNFTVANATYSNMEYRTDLVIRAANVRFVNCKITGIVVCDVNQNPTASVTLEDCTIDGGKQSRAAVAFDNLTIRRCDIRGGQHNIAMGTNVTVEDSYLHDQYAGPAYHNNGIISNGGSGYTVTGNMIWCNATGNPAGGGATANLSLIGDFSTIENAVIDGNYIHETPGGYGAQLGYHPVKPYPNATNITVTNNVFQRGSSGVCGLYGPYTAYLNANGNVFSNNAYDDATPIA